MSRYHARVRTLLLAATAASSIALSSWSNSSDHALAVSLSHSRTHSDSLCSLLSVSEVNHITGLGVARAQYDSESLRCDYLQVGDDQTGVVVISNVSGSVIANYNSKKSLYSNIRANLRGFARARRLLRILLPAIWMAA